jgi:hypothetical protein
MSQKVGVIIYAYYSYFFLLASLIFFFLFVRAYSLNASFAEVMPGEASPDCDVEIV